MDYKSGEAYVDVGTLNGYREALRLLDSSRQAACAFGVSFHLEVVSDIR